MSIADFDNLSFRQGDNILKGYMKRLEREERQRTEDLRIIVWSNLAPFSKVKLEDIKFERQPEAQDQEPQDPDDAIKQIEQSKAFWAKQDAKKKKQK